MLNALLLLISSGSMNKIRSRPPKSEPTRGGRVQVFLEHIVTARWRHKC